MKRDSFGPYTIWEGKKLYLPEVAIKAYTEGIFKKFEKSECNPKYESEGKISMWDIGPYWCWGDIKFGAEARLTIERTSCPEKEIRIDSWVRNLLGADISIASVGRSIRKGDFSGVKIGMPVKFQIVKLRDKIKPDYSFWYAINVEAK